MRRLMALIAAGAVMAAAQPALAGAQDHEAHGSSPEQAPAASPPAAVQCTPDHATMGHCRMPKNEPPATESSSGETCTAEHAEMGHCAPRDAGSAVDRAALDHGKSGTALEPGNDSAPRPVPADYADRIWGREAMADARGALHREHGGGRFSRVMLDLAEIRFAGREESYKFEGDAWFGGDIDRLAIKAQGKGRSTGPLHDLELKALYSRAIDPYFNLQAGIRHDIRPDPSRTYAVIGIEGLAPYWFEVDGYAYLSTKGELRASISGEYDQRLTQRLILQPRLELGFSAQDILDIGIGAGFTDAEIGLRLRYEIAREFAPYIGVVHERRFGNTAALARAADKSPSNTSLVVGVRAWF